MFSPDGLSVAFRLGRGLTTVSLAGGRTFTVVTQGALLSDMDWGSDGMLYFVGEQREIERVPATGGEAERVILRSDGGTPEWPDVLPDGRGLLITLVAGGPTNSRIAVVGPEGGEVREILTGTMARYAASGHVVYTTAEGTLMAAPFDLKRLEVAGPSVVLLEGVQVKTGSASQFALSETGTLLYKAGEVSQYELLWVNRAGAVEPVDPAWTGDFNYPALSPAGTRLAVAIQDESRDIWVKQLDRGPSIKLTFEGFNDRPTWTPDGGSVTFTSNRAGEEDLWTKRADGSAQAVLELDRERTIFDALWSPDGEWLIYRTRANTSGNGDILAVRPGQDTEPVALVATEFVEDQMTLSPDGRWLAYASNETGRDEIYVVPFPNAGDAKWPVSTSGGREPLWSHSGRELFYRNGQGEMVSVEVETEPTFAPGQSEVLFSAAEFRAAPNRRQYDVTLDDERYIMIRQAGDADAVTKLIWVQNFFEELKERVPN